MNRILQGLVGLFTLIFLGLGVRWMFMPFAAAAESGLELAGTLGSNTARGDLGGMFIAAAVMLVLGLVRREPAWLRAVALLTGCIATGRVIGMLVDGFASSSAVPFVVELVMVVSLLALVRTMEPESPAPG
ncbi:MAG: DUF4345 family protein [Deltaproteobacteria bacterium]|jgi:hypothetical protein|nr:DUF4345 family protein [Deltaproteobacteria bacterium]MBW2383460.1 DUF4345 family protein [Deltaproteobacteria bacterium]MBW2696833.1 DUF4345 family protein [Deltaproteobacteria bacterium]